MAVAEHSVHYLEIVTPDVHAARDLYASAHGWQFQAAQPELGDAFVASLPDGSLCGIRAPMHDQEKPVVRTYVRVDDLEAAVESVKASGATMAIDRMEIPGRGTIAIYMHGDNEHGLWQV